jgi:uncharacterized damage-inducible protein DinB
MLALAAKVEDEGQLNLAKLLRAAADGLLRQAAYHESLPADKEGLANAVQDLTQALTALELAPDLVQAIQHGAQNLAQGRLTLIEDAPPPFVCRTCGHIQLGEPAAPCPTCGAIPATFQKFPPVYWLGAFDLFQALAYLRRTPDQVAAVLEELPDAVLDRQPANGGWAIRHVIAHLRDAQLLVDYRIQLMLAEEIPSLEAKSVFEWATQAGERPETVQEIFAAYRASRRNTLTSLERIPLADWWRSGRHQEFGEVTILQQASYFAMHEVTHLPQLEALKRGND